MVTAPSCGRTHTIHLIIQSNEALKGGKATLTIMKTLKSKTLEKIYYCKTFYKRHAYSTNLFMTLVTHTLLT